MDRVPPGLAVRGRTGGLDGYLGRASRSGKDNMGQARRKARKAEETHGPISFVADSTDADALGALIALKRAQYAATGARDYFAAPERVALAHRLLETRVDGFAGVLSTVHVGPRLLAAHFGIRSGGVLHWWFPVYDPQFGAFAPGWILLRELAVAAPSLGVTRLDLGRGDDEYKRRAKTGESMVCQGLSPTAAPRSPRDASGRRSSTSPSRRPSRVDFAPPHDGADGDPRRGEMPCCRPSGLAPTLREAMVAALDSEPIGGDFVFALHRNRPWLPTELRSSAARSTHGQSPHTGCR